MNNEPATVTEEQGRAKAVMGALAELWAAMDEEYSDNSGLRREILDRLSNPEPGRNVITDIDDIMLAHGFDGDPLDLF